MSEEKQSEVVAIFPDIDRVDSALSYLREALATGKATGVLVVVFEADGHDARMFGELLKRDLVYACARIQHRVLDQDRSQDEG